MTGRTDSSEVWPPKVVVCVGAVVKHGDRVLFVRQAQGHDLAGQWSIPWGFVDAGESPDAAAVRETEEESGVRATVEGLLGMQNLRQARWVALVFLCDYQAGAPVSDGGQETDAARFFSMAEMEAFEEPFEPWCEWLVRRVLNGEYGVLRAEAGNPYRPRTAYF